MTRYSVQPRDWIFGKDYGFLSFARKVGKSKSKNLSSKYNQKLLDHAKQSATDALKTASKKNDSKYSRKDWWSNWKKIADKITRVSKNLPKNNPETNEEEMLRERYTSPEDKQILMV